MVINGQNFHAIWVDNNKKDIVRVIDQQKLPFEFAIKNLVTFNDAFSAIKDMTVRGAPLIGVTAAYGLYLAMLSTTCKGAELQLFITAKCNEMEQARPTAVNLSYAITRIKSVLEGIDNVERAREIVLREADLIKQQEIDYCEAIGIAGLTLIEEISRKKKRKPVNILTHCNAGWLACVDWGTALAPIYKAHKKGIAVHVWVDETRPRNQGSKLTAFELMHEGVPHTVIPDNTGGHLMQHGMVDLVLVGSDRTTRTGDVCNKIGTYLKALAAFDNRIPFYVALPSSSIDFEIENGFTNIPIEQRNANEVSHIEGKEGKVQLVPNGCKVANYGFDVTPARLVTGLITEKGICPATKEGISALFSI